MSCKRERERERETETETETETDRDRQRQTETERERERERERFQCSSTPQDPPKETHRSGHTARKRTERRVSYFTPQLHSGQRSVGMSGHRVR